MNHFLAFSMRFQEIRERLLEVPRRNVLCGWVSAISTSLTHLWAAFTMAGLRHFILPRFSSYPLSKIILALQYEDYLLNGFHLKGNKARSSSLDLDSELVGGYSSLHIRRGDLQFKEVKFDSNQW